MSARASQTWPCAATGSPPGSWPPPAAPGASACSSSPPTRSSPAIATTAAATVETDATAPRNAYGASKLAGEEAARAVFADGPGSGSRARPGSTVRPATTSPTRSPPAADRLPEGEPLPVVADEFGSPTYTLDLARAILDLVSLTDGGIYHLVNTGGAEPPRVGRSGPGGAPAGPHHEAHLRVGVHARLRPAAVGRAGHVARDGRRRATPALGDRPGGLPGRVRPAYCRFDGVSGRS